MKKRKQINKHLYHKLVYPEYTSSLRIDFYVISINLGMKLDYIKNLEDAVADDP